MLGDDPTIVIDNGSGLCKAGYAGDEEPRSVFSSVVAHPANRPSVYIGDDPYVLGAVARRKSPIERGDIRDWTDMEKIWHHQFHSELYVDPAEHPVLITEPLDNSGAAREPTTEIMYETFGVPSFCLANQCALSLFSTGRTTGVVAEIGEGLCQIAPVYEGYHIPMAAARLNLGGCDVTDFLQQMLHQQGYNFASFSERRIIRLVKEQYAYVALDFDAEMHQTANTANHLVSYDMPDGSSIAIGNERFRCAEILLRPSMSGIGSEGVHEKVLQTITACDVDIRKDMYENIVVSGGSTLLPGFVKRFEQDIKRLAPPAARIKIVGSDNPKYAVWSGGSVFAQTTTVQEKLITREQYNAVGFSAVKWKCF
jgi:actin-related protein